MKSFYSLIKISPNSLSDENLTIGMILYQEKSYKVKFSDTKLNLAKSIVDINKDLLNFVTNEIKKKITETNNLISQSDEDLFGYDIINSDYFSYLNSYSNGIFKFSKPNLIAGAVNFTKLYQLLVDSKVKSKKSNEIKIIEQEFYNRIDHNLIKKVEGKIHTKITLDSRFIPATSNYEIDCLGKNGSLIGAKSLTFTQTKDTLQKAVNTYISVIAQLSASYSQNLGDNKFYLIADEPSEKGSYKVKYWNQLRKNEKIFQVIPSSESGLVAETVNSKNAHTFLEGI